MNCVRRAFSIALVALCACAGPARDSRPRLPFHVAVIPIAAPIELEPGAKQDALHLTVDARHLERLLLAELNQRCVTHATLLAPPEDLSAFALASTQERDAHWLRCAKEIGADLVLECELEFRPEVEHAHNEKFWLNLPLFLLGGPACYFVDDRTYRAHAALKGRLLDLNPIVAGRADFEDGLSQLIEVKARFEQTALDFLDRAGQDASEFATSLIVPPGLLAQDNRAVQRSLEDHAEHELARDFADAMMEQSSELLFAEPVASFHLDPALRVARDGSVVRVNGDVILRRGEVERLDGWRLIAGARSVSGEFHTEQPDKATRSLRHPLVHFGLDAEIELDAGVSDVRLEIVEAGPNPAVRSFTFVIG